jgi:hypothetical protein
MKHRCTVLGFLFLMSRSTSSACTSVELPLKPVRHICGIATNQIGERISNATLTLLKAGAEIRTIQTDADGKFEFGKLEAGDYELRALSPGYSAMQSHIKVGRATTKCERGLQIVFALVCGSGITKPKR